MNKASLTKVLKVICEDCPDKKKSVGFKSEKLCEKDSHQFKQIKSIKLNFTTGSKIN